jgi:hypothetical protein
MSVIASFAALVSLPTLAGSLLFMSYSIAALRITSREFNGSRECAAWYLEVEGFD